MNDPKVTQWIADSLNEELGKDPETGEGANVDVVSYEIVDCPMNGKHIVAKLKAWGEDEEFEGIYFSHQQGWEIEGDLTGCPIIDGIEW